MPIVISAFLFSIEDHDHEVVVYNENYKDGDVYFDELERHRVDFDDENRDFENVIDLCIELKHKYEGQVDSYKMINMFQLIEPSTVFI